MNPRGETLALAIICTVVVLLSLCGLIWFFTWGLSLGGVDPLMILLISLLMGGIFSLQLFPLAKRAGWLEWMKALRGKTPAGVPTESSAQDPK